MDLSVLWQLPLMLLVTFAILFGAIYGLRWAYMADRKATAKRYRKMLATKLGIRPEFITEADVNKEREQYWDGRNIFAKTEYWNEVQASATLLDILYAERTHTKLRTPWNS